MKRKKIIILGTSKIAEIVYSCIMEDETSSLKPVAFCADAAYFDKIFFENAVNWRFLACAFLFGYLV